MFGASLLSFMMLIAPSASVSVAAFEADRAMSSATRAGLPHSSKATDNADAAFNASKTPGALSPAVLPALNLTVNAPGDAADVTLDGDCDADINTDGSQCTLRAAIQEANNTPGDDTISFSLPPNSTITLTSELDPIVDGLAITGPASRVTVSGDNLYRVFTVTDGIVSISNLTIANGLSDVGGGIYNVSDLTISNSTFTGNQAVGLSAEGGAIDSEGGTLTIINSTISGNSSDGDGGGLLNCGSSTATLANVTITDNRADADSNAAGSGGGIGIQAGTVTLQNSIVAVNSSSGGAPDISGAVNLDGFNLIQSTSSATITETMNPGTNITGQDPLLDPLGNYGGPTQTHRLTTLSPAIDTGKNFATDNTDQRGRLRPVDLASPNASGGDGSDIGAFELQDETEQGGTPAFIVNTPDDHDDGVCSDADCSLREAIIAANSDSGLSTITFDIPGAGPHIIQLTAPLDDLETDMNIQGPTDETVEVRGEDLYSVFTIFDPGVTVSISDLTISNGGELEGGGIYNEGSLTIDNSTFTGNGAGFGGAIENVGSLTISNSRFTDNQAAFGGAIDNVGFLTVNDSTFTDNQAEDGGAISNIGFLNIDNSTFTGNSSVEAGGAIETEDGSLIIVNSTISGNSSDGDGGGLALCGCASATAVLTNVTITANHADAENDGSGLGGGINGVGEAPVLSYETRLSPAISVARTTTSLLTTLTAR